MRFRKIGLTGRVSLRVLAAAGVMAPGLGVGAAWAADKVAAQVLAADVKTAPDGASAHGGANSAPDSDVTVACARVPVTTITVTGSPLPLAEAGPSVTILGSATLDAIQGPDLARALARIPGVNVARTGPLGSATGIFVRGADSDQVLVTIDGVRVADLASTSGAYDTGPLQLENVARIELLRGSNSVIWGSQAMAGVLAITTREVNGAEASAEYGGYNTTSLSAATGIVRGPYAVSLDAGYLHSDGFPARVGDTHDDGIDEWRVGGKARVEVAAGLTLKGNLRYADTKLGYDATGMDTRDVQRTHDTSGAVAAAYAAGALTLDATASLSDLRRHYATFYGPSDYAGREERGDLKGKLALPADLRLDFGAAHEWDRASDTYDARSSARLDEGYAMLGYYTDRLTLAAGGRVDSHSTFGTHWTGGANLALRLAAGWRLRGAWGQGFRAPSLYQLYGSYVGNTTLKPESDDAYEAGIEHVAGRFHAGVTWFRRDSRNLIDFDYALGLFGEYANVSRARATGVEAQTGATLGTSLDVAVNYTWLRAENRDTGLALARRPRNTVNVSADWRTPLPGVTLGGDIAYVSRTVDYGYLGNALPIADHVTATVRGSLALSPALELFGRVENLGNAQAATVYGYNAPGRTGHVGVRVKL